MLRFEMSMTLPSAARSLRREVFMEEQGFSYEFDDTDNRARVAVKKDRRGQHLGEAVMNEAEAALALKGAKKVALSAQVQAAGFYKKLGYVQVGDEYLDEHCPHVDMEKLLGSAPAGAKEGTK